MGNEQLTTTQRSAAEMMDTLINTFAGFLNSIESRQQQEQIADNWLDVTWDLFSAALPPSKNTKDFWKTEIKRQIFDFIESQKTALRL